MESSEVVSVIDLLLVDVSVYQASPHFFVVPFHCVHLNHQLNKQFLVVNDFILPFCHQDWFVVIIHKFLEVGARKSTVLSESYHKLVNLLNVKIIKHTLESRLPEVKTELRAAV